MELKIAEIADIEVLKPLLKQYHKSENIVMSDSAGVQAITPLLGDNQFGRIWLIFSSEEAIGYITLCFGYSIEFGGRDAFIDEFYIREQFRGQGIGKTVLMTIKNKAKSLGIRAIHLEVARTNDKARKLYKNMGFIPRENYRLMSCKTG